MLDRLEKAAFAAGVGSGCPYGDRGSTAAASMRGRVKRAVQDRAARRRVRAAVRRPEEVLPGKTCRRVGHLVPRSEREVDVATGGGEFGAEAPLDLLGLGVQAAAVEDLAEEVEGEVGDGQECGRVAPREDGWEGVRPQ
jgi:hypothetical protein